MLFIWDYILTLGMEVNLVWKSKWNLMKALYLFQRYLPFIDPIWIALYRQANVFPNFLCLFCRRSMRCIFDRDWVLEDILRPRTFVKLTRPTSVVGTYFASSIYDRWARSI